MTEKYWPQPSPTHRAPVQVPTTVVRMEQVQVYRRTGIRVIDDHSGEILKGFRSRARANTYLKQKIDTGEYELRFGSSIAVKSLDYDFALLPRDYRHRFFYVLCYCLVFTYLASSMDVPVLYVGAVFFLLGCLYEMWSYLRSEHTIARHGLAVAPLPPPRTSPLRLLLVISIGYGLCTYGLINGQYSLGKVTVSIQTMPELYWISITALFLIASNALWRLLRLYWGTDT